MPIATTNIPAFRSALLAWHRRRGLQTPWRESGDPYQVLVAAVMAQQTQMSRVLPKYDEFVTSFPTIDALAAASTADVLRAWAPLGYNMRALRLHKAAQRIASMDGWPRTAEELQQIEGIGPFTAAIIASFAFGQRSVAIDVNVVRVLSRLSGNLEPLPERALVPLANKLCSRRLPARWNQALMDLGAAVCTARKPKCDVCPISRWCRARPLFAKPPVRHVAETRATYRTQPPFAGSTRYYRGRIVQALRELPTGGALTVRQLLARIPNRNGLGTAGLRLLLATLRRDGLVRIDTWARSAAVAALLVDALSSLCWRYNMETYEDDNSRLVKEGPLGPYANNVYLIQDRNSGDTVIIDAPQDATRILDALSGGTVTGILVTHRHPDHWMGIDEAKAATNAPVTCHAEDAERYADKVDGAIADGEEIAVGSLRIKTIHTPGHTAGSTCFVIGRHLLSGDALFPGGPGRTDSPEALQQSIASITAKLFVLPDDTLVHPGHGDGGSIGQSKREYAVFASKEHPADLCGDVTWEGS